MDWIQILVTVLGSSTLVGVVSAVLAHRLALRKHVDGEGDKVRNELRTLFREERAENHECLAKVEKLQTELTEARIQAARWETRCTVMETQLTEIRTAILREYVKATPSLPPPTPAG